MNDFLEICRGSEPLIVAFPHSGIDIPANLEASFVSPWLARKDGDWWIDRLYAFARDLGATTIRTRISRSVIDCNRDPLGVSLYPGQATTGLCPVESFDGEPLYSGTGPDETEIDHRRQSYFDPYHEAVSTELSRLRTRHANVVLYDAHSIRSAIPRLFPGQLPQFSIGTNEGRTCAPALAKRVEQICASSGRSYVLNGRFKGGWTTRHYGVPHKGIHAIQMELAIRGYHHEPTEPTQANWPGDYDPAYAAPLAATLSAILKTCLAFATPE